ncbi:SOS response-associated peptidase [Nocardia colli]|uniref:Abasic site processing protein n=1 Tax=Nocardia colli TaxID=2545717 RepID=A0A5N0EJ41_9NOCA|nr:SOS response-associated peptidase [Nocardia colli]KAA8888304.1 SOS response-associated peptidase [Nocardia colli]
MCGRYATTTDPGRLAAELDALDETESTAGAGTFTNYNVAPTTQILTVVERHEHGHKDDDPRLRLRRMRWGLIPLWTKAAEPGVPVKGKPLFNARADKAATTPSFRDAVKYRRCLIPMDGWYEWVVEPDPDAKGKAVKKPFFMAQADGSRLYMAGLWSVWRDKSLETSEPLLSCTILTTDAVGDLTRIHDRMPLPMPQEHWDAWLDPDHPAPAELLETPSEAAIAGIVARPVPSLVNSVKNNGPELLDQVSEDEEAGQISLL